MATVTYSPPHPIVFIFDPSNNSMRVPVYDPEAVVSANASCVSIRTIADVDGDATVTLAETLPRDVIESGVEVFHGSLDTPGRKVAAVTSENQKLLEIYVKESRASVRVLVDDETYPAKIWVEAH